MKSKHLARADFLRELKKKTEELYSLGIGERGSAEWRLKSEGIRGFIECAMLMEVAADLDVRQLIEKAHEDQFGETLTAYRERKGQESEVDENDQSVSGLESLWDKFDSPAYKRKKKPR